MSAPAATPDRTVARIVAIVFGLLVVATVGAFFVAQRLKTAPTVISGVRFTPKYFSPNGDGVQDRVLLSFGITETDTIAIEVIDEKGDVVRTFPDRHARRYTRVRQVWNGKDDDGRRAPDGVYRVRVTLRDRGRSMVLPTSFFLDTHPPRPRVLRIGPKDGAGTGPQILPRPDGKPAIAFLRAPGRNRVIKLFRTSPGRPTLILKARLKAGATRWSWDGRIADGRRAPAGTYVVVVQVTDRAGNVGTSVPLGRDGLPNGQYGRPYPSRGGITVRYLGVQPPATAVTAGSAATFFVDARGQRYTWSLRRVGRPPVKRGRTTAPQLRLSTPRGSAGLDLLRVVSADGRVAQSPLAIGSRSRHAVLVVLPFLTWQGLNPVDDDGDGRPNTLTAGLPARVDRVFAGHGLPAGAADQAGPILAALDAQGRQYDVTTDIALAQGTGPKLAGHRGVLVAGDARWLPDVAARRLRNFVRAGGRVASFGTGALQRYATLTVTGGVTQALRPTLPALTDLFGARPDGIEPKPVQLVSGVDTIQLFAGTDGQFGPFTGVERFAEPAATSSVLASATDGNGVPIILATRFGRGTVVRFPVPELPATLATDPELTQLLRNTWTLLSR